MSAEDSREGCGHPVYEVCNHKPCAALDLIAHQIRENGASPQMLDFLDKMVRQAGDCPCASEIAQVDVSLKTEAFAEGVDIKESPERIPQDSFESLLGSHSPRLAAFGC